MYGPGGIGQERGGGVNRGVLNLLLGPGEDEEPGHRLAVGPIAERAFEGLGQTVGEASAEAVGMGGDGCPAGSPLIRSARVRRSGRVLPEEAELSAGDLGGAEGTGRAWG